MKRYGFLLLSVVIAFVTLASNLLLPDASNSSDPLAIATKKPINTPVKKPKKPSIKTVLKQTVYIGSQVPGPVSQEPCKNSKKPIVLIGLADVQQLELLDLDTCAWEMSKDVLATITKPDGTTRIETLQTYPYSPWGIIELNYTPTAFDPVGSYKIHFSNGEQVLDVEFNVSRITEPGAIIIPEDDELQIYNFYPYEKISVFHYDLLKTGGWFEILYTWTLLDWQELVTGADGNLRIKISDIQDTYVVIGEKTGEYNTDRDIGRIESIVSSGGSQFMGNQPLCKGSPVSRLAVGSTAYVTTSTRIRQKSAPSIGILGRLPAGTYFSITDGPECREGTTWWYGKANDIEGWVAENENETYLLEPVP